MQYRIFRISASGDPEAEEALNHFLRSHRVVSVSKELAVLPGGASWYFCVEYLLGGEPQTERRPFDRKTDRVDYKEVLSEEDFTLFVKLRDRRKEMAIAEAVQVYTVATNEQLAQMARGRCQTLEELKSIPGFGEGKISKYGIDFLNVIAGFSNGGKENECTGPET